MAGERNGLKPNFPGCSTGVHAVVRGNPFRTVDISNSGTRVGEIQQPAQVGEVIALQYEHREAPFEVVWVGSRSTGTGVSAGLRYLTCDGKIWGTALSQADRG